MINHTHAKDPHLRRQVTSNSTHAQNSQHLALGIMTQRRHILTLAPPLTPSQFRHTLREVPERREDEEDGRIGSRVVDGLGNVRDVDLALGAGGDVDTVVASAIVAYELDGRWERREQLGVDQTGDGERGKGAEDGDDAIERAGLGLLDEVVTVVGLGRYQVGVFRQCLPVFLGRFTKGLSVGSDQRVWFRYLAYWSIRPRSRTLGFWFDAILNHY